MPHRRPSRYAIQLTAREYQGLQALSRSPEVTQGVKRRARLILLVASGQPVTTAALYAFISQRHAYKWLQRWLDEGIVGLYDRERGEQIDRSARRVEG